MTGNTLFNLAFLSQIILISALLPRTLFKRACHLLKTYPAAEYPRLYPKGPGSYERGLNRFVGLNAAIFLVGMFFWVTFNLDATRDDYAGVAWGVFMLQSVPFVLLEVFTFRTWKLMREADARTTRKAELRPRRLTDAFSYLQTGLVASVFIAFCLFVNHINQFGYPWFGGWLNVIIIGMGNLLLAGIVLWNLFGRKRDPYMEERDRLRRIRQMARQFVLVSVAVTVYATVTITLQAYELREFKQLAMTLYAQLLALGCYFTIYADQGINFEVYRAEPVSN